MNLTLNMERVDRMKHAEKCASRLNCAGCSWRGLLVGALVEENFHFCPECQKLLTVAEGISGACNCDGCHTFPELYEHRIELFLALCRALRSRERDASPFRRTAVWRAQSHSDGSEFDGWFIMGIQMSDDRQITYHLPMSRWDDADFAWTLDKAPEYDGHTSGDVLQRLRRL